MTGRARLSLVWLLTAFGCRGHDLELPQDPVPCSTDRDCPSDQPHCAGTGTPDRPAVVACTRICQIDAECPDGYHCDRSSSCSACEEDCTPDGCAEGFVCQPDGRCLLVPCMDAGAPACPAGWRCEPGAPSTENQGAKPSSNDATRVARGCARNPCDQSDGIDCNDLWRCLPERSAYPTGCVPLPCSETGRCSSDVVFICTPTSDGPRTEGTDAHGCVFRNCDEGSNFCSAVQICENGVCRLRTCAEYACPAGRHCLEAPSGVSCPVDVVPTAGTTGAGTGGALGGSAGTAGTLSGGNGGTSAGGSGFFGPGYCE